jgi:glycosyltransferase involved in cell wall biosynthesis
MKVCILTTSFPAYKGHFQSPFIFKLAESLAERLDVDVVCPYYKESRKKEEIINNVKVHRFQYLYPAFLQSLYRGGGLPHNLKRSFIARLELIPYLISYFLKSMKYCKGADIIHAQWILSGLIGVFMKKLYKKPLVLSTRGIAVQMASKNKLMKPILKYVLKNCDYITPNNLHHAHSLLKFGVSKNKILAVPNGVDTELYKPRSKDNIRKKLGLDVDKKIILFVGWLIERKGVSYLVNAASKILTDRDDVILYLVGEGSLRYKLVEMVRSMNIQDKVKLMGSMLPEEVALYMAAADVFVLPSLSEGRPNVVCEAMLSGTPVVATDIGGSNELIKDGRTGFLIKPKSSGAIAEKVNKLLLDNGLSKKFSKEARNYVLDQKASWNDCAKRFIAVYKNVLEKK